MSHLKQIDDNLEFGMCKCNQPNILILFLFLYVIMLFA